MFLEVTQNINTNWANKYGTFIAKLKKQMPNACWVHCFFDRQAVAAKTFLQEYSQVLNININIVNYIKGKALQIILHIAVYS